MRRLTLVIMKVVNQMILSTKHLLTTVSEKIEFNEDFNKFFTINAGTICPVLNSDAVDELDDWAIWINPNEIQKSEELDQDSEFNTYINDKFYVQNLVTKESVLIESIEPREMYFTQESLDLLKKGKGYIKFKDMDSDTSLFEMIIMNNELTRPLYTLINLLNKGSNETLTYSEMAQIFTQLLLDANIDAQAVAGELIINRLIRQDPDDNYERPNFAKKHLEPYQIYTVIRALERNKSPLIGLSSQDIKRQIISDDLITKKHGESFIDPLFKETVSTDRLKEIHAKIHKRRSE